MLLQLFLLKMALAELTHSKKENLRIQRFIGFEMKYNLYCLLAYVSQSNLQVNVSWSPQWDSSIKLQLQ